MPAPLWICVGVIGAFTATNRAAVIVSHLELRKGMRVLDVGCGPGRVSLPVGRDAGFEAQAFFGNRIAYTLHLRKPNRSLPA